MTILDGIPFDEIDANTLNRLVASDASESLRLEFKQKEYNRTDAGRREFLKDVCAFANANGGYLILGIEESDGVATAVKALECSVDEELGRMESLAQTGIEPRILGLSMRAIAVAEGSIIVLRIPRSFSRPHRVCSQQINKFYVRRSTIILELSLEEIRELIMEALTLEQRIRKLRDERLQLIENGETPVRLNHDRGRLIIHTAPVSALSNTRTIHPESLQPLSSYFCPPRASEYGTRFNFDGVLISSRSNEFYNAYTQIYHTGFVESICTGIVFQRDKNFFIGSSVIERESVDATKRYLQGLAKLNLSPPFIVLISLQQVRDVYLGVKNSYSTFDFGEMIDRDTLRLPEIRIDTIDSPIDVPSLLRPTFDALWNAAGFAKSKNYNTDGTWRL